MDDDTSPRSGDGSSDRYLAIKVVMMPRDTNPHGTIFGGVLLSNVDMAGAAGAQHEALSRGWPEPSLVTVAMDKVEFHQPVFVGDVVSFWTSVLRVGHTSITMHVGVETDRNGKTLSLTDATVTYVAVDMAERSPKPLRGS